LREQTDVGASDTTTTTIEQGCVGCGCYTYRTSTMNTRVLLSSIFFMADSVVSGYFRICEHRQHIEACSASTDVHAWRVRTVMAADCDYVRRWCTGEDNRRAA
jgi:hypothetical protein